MTDTTPTTSAIPTALPQLRGTRFVTDGGMETDLIFHHGVDLPEFAAFPLLRTEAGRGLLRAYYDAYADIARRVPAGLLLETPTWRANLDWGARLGWSAAGLDAVNGEAVEMLLDLRDRYAADVAPVLVSGMVGPRGDGYSAAAQLRPDEAAEYHRPQLQAFQAAGADLATAYTLTHVGEAIGIVQAAQSVGLPVAISFTVEVDGRLPDGASVADAIAAVDRVAPPAYFLLNCAHPTHMQAGLGGHRPELDRIAGLRVNASSHSHAELDAAEDIDEGDISELVASHTALGSRLPALTITGGCCGTDARHVGALWGLGV